MSKLRVLILPHHLFMEQLEISARLLIWQSKMHQQFFVLMKLGALVPDRKIHMTSHLIKKKKRANFYAT